MALTESKRRDFVAQMIELITNNQARLTAEGFDSTARLTALSTKSATAIADENLQTEAKASAKLATQQSKASLSLAYKEASNLADAISGLLGKDDPLVQEIRKLRN